MPGSESHTVPSRSKMTITHAGSRVQRPADNSATPPEQEPGSSVLEVLH